MITGEMKNKVDRLWEMFWTGGLTNPLDIIEQITYLMFIRDLDTMDETRQKYHPARSRALPHPSPQIQPGAVPATERAVLQLPLGYADDKGHGR